MATPLTGSPTAVTPTTQPTPASRIPRTVVGVKEVSIALVNYIDGEGVQQTQLAVLGDNTAFLLSGKQMGISQHTVYQGQAADWLRDGIFEKLGRKK